MDKRIYDGKSFSGIGFDSHGVPVDILSLHLLGSLLDDYSLFIVDEFPKMNGIPENESNLACKGLERVLDACDLIYKPTKRLKASDFMNSKAYTSKFDDIKACVVRDSTLLALTENTIPQKYRNNPHSLDYPIHEYTCVKHLTDSGFTSKIGQKRERLYDVVISQLFPEMSFSYLRNCYALNTPKSIEVTHYLPCKNGVTKDNRILVGIDSLESAERKIRNSNLDAMSFYAALGSAAEYVIDGNLNQLSQASSELREFAVDKMRTYVLKPLLERQEIIR